MSTLSDHELSRLVAEKVARMTVCDDKTCIDNEVNAFVELPPYATSADAVLDLLNRHHWQVRSWVPTKESGRMVDVILYKLASDVGNIIWIRKTAPTFARAACLALLKAAGVEV